MTETITAEPAESTSLIVVEPEVPPPPTYREIKMNDFIALKREGLENAPDSEKPFYLLAAEGAFLSRHSILGRGLTHQKYWPKFLPKLGQNKGFFWYDAPMIPEEICAQIVHFFTRIYDKHKTEAEVILLMNYETKEWSVFVPPQKVSGASVESAFDPKDIPEKHLIVGTMHSHCDFSAFHSGTDLGDASDMDGVHFTIGNLNHSEIEIVAMVMQNGVAFDYAPSLLADFANPDAATAPEEWDDKVVPTASLVSKHLPSDYKQVFDTFGKKPTVTTYQPYKPTENKAVYNSQNWEEEFWQEYQEHRGWLKGNDDFKAKAALNAPHWEDYLEDSVLDDILLSDLLTDEDMTKISENPARAQDINFWRGIFLMKIAESVNILHQIGMDVQYNAKMVDSTKGIKRPKEVAPETIEEVVTVPEKKKEAPIVIDKNLGLAYTTESDDGLLPDDTGRSLAERLEEEGFTILEIKSDGAVVIDTDKMLDGDFKVLKVN